MAAHRGNRTTVDEPGFIGGTNQWTPQFQGWKGLVHGGSVFWEAMAESLFKEKEDQLVQECLSVSRGGELTMDEDILRNSRNRSTSQKRP